MWKILASVVSVHAFTSAILSGPIAQAFLPAEENNALPPIAWVDQERGRIVSGRFVKVQCWPAATLPKSSGARPGDGLLHVAVQPVLGLFEVEAESGVIGEKRQFLVDISLQSITSASIAWLSADCTLALEPLAIVDAAQAAILQSLSTSLVGEQHIPAEIFSIACGGSFGMIISPSPLTEQLPGVSQALMLSDLAEYLSGHLVFRRIDYGGGTWSVVPRDAVIRLSAGAPWIPQKEKRDSGGKGAVWNQTALLHPDTRALSAMCFISKQSGTGIGLGVNGPLEMPLVAFWPDGIMIRFSHLDPNGEPVFEEGRFDYSAMRDMCSWIREAKRGKRQSLIGAELVPDSSCTIGSLIGFGEPIEVNVDFSLLSESQAKNSKMVDRYPLTWACRKLLGDCSRVPLLDGKLSHGRKWEKVLVEIPIGSRIAQLAQPNSGGDKTKE